MFDLATFRELLGPHAVGLTDAEVQRIMDVEQGFVDAIFEMWLRDRNPLPAPVAQDTS